MILSTMVQRNFRCLTSIVVHADDFVSWLISEQRQDPMDRCVAWSVKARERSLLEKGFSSMALVPVEL